MRACDELGVMLDLLHLNAAGFWDVGRTTRRPRVAIHSNAHGICPAPRNLVDDQLRAMRDSGGLAGVCLSVSELRHIGHLLAILGPDGVAIGSDLDGALLPAQIGDAGGLGSLVAAMQDQGYDPDLLRKLCCDNWLNVLERCWGSP